MPASNIKVGRNGSVSVSVNTRLYPLDVIYSASYMFLDRAYILLDGDPQKAVEVRMVPKGKEDPKTMGMEFNNELLNYSLYKTQSEKNAAVRQAILQRAIITGDTPSGILPAASGSDEDTDGGYLDDPEGIAIPWEEKFGKGKKSGGK
jgi:His-Xaa-Ser system protein HxsD